MESVAIGPLLTILMLLRKRNGEGNTPAISKSNGAAHVNFQKLFEVHVDFDSSGSKLHERFRPYRTGS